MQKRTIILGGAALIGTDLCKPLLSQGRKICRVNLLNIVTSQQFSEPIKNLNIRYIRHNFVKTSEIDYHMKVQRLKCAESRSTKK